MLTSISCDFPVSGKKSLTVFIEDCFKNEMKCSMLVLRFLLNGGGEASQVRFINVARVLTKLRDAFFEIWDKKLNDDSNNDN